MAKSEAGRHWQFEQEDLSFRHRFFWGISFDLAGGALHLNPGIPASFIKNPPDILLVAGAWGLPTNILTSLLARVLASSVVLFWSESHWESRRLENWLVDKLRVLLFRLYDGFAVPGKSAAEYIRHCDSNKPILYLPNTVDESVFRDKVRTCRSTKDRIRGELGVPKHKRILLLPARLTHEKGIIPLLAAIHTFSPSLTESFTLLIAGDGPLKTEISLWTEQHPSIDVRLVGYLAETELVKLYAAADTFILPSLRDPNPLSVIEALWAGLPLILSDRVGNHWEALSPDVNGWLFDPESKVAIRDVFADCAALSDAELQGRGRASTTVARDRFDSAAIVTDFVATTLARREEGRWS
jgi:glycosyltransferase involved in cell wall biosynthesis